MCKAMEDYSKKMKVLGAIKALKLSGQSAEEIIKLITENYQVTGEKNIHGGTVKERGLSKELAALIDNARVVAIISASEWQAQKGKRLLKKTIEYIKDDLFPNLSGERYVGSIPVKMAEFITDCWLAVG